MTTYPVAFEIKMPGTYQSVPATTAWPGALITFANGTQTLHVNCDSGWNSSGYFTKEAGRKPWTLVLGGMPYTSLP